MGERGENGEFARTDRTTRGRESEDHACGRQCLEKSLQGSAGQVRHESREGTAGHKKIDASHTSGTQQKSYFCFLRSL